MSSLSRPDICLLKPFVQLKEELEKRKLSTQGNKKVSVSLRFKDIISATSVNVSSIVCQELMDRLIEAAC